MSEGRPHYATRRDANQGELKAGLEHLGFVVLDVSQLAHLGFDLLVCGWHGGLRQTVWLAVEVKTEDGRLTKREAQFIDDMQRRFREPPLLVARDVIEVLKWFMRGE
jgi:hypothetical protein